MAQVAHLKSDGVTVQVTIPAGVAHRVAVNAVIRTIQRGTVYRSPRCCVGMAGSVRMDETILENALEISIVVVIDTLRTVELRLEPYGVGVGIIVRVPFVLVIADLHIVQFDRVMKNRGVRTRIESLYAIDARRQAIECVIVLVIGV